MRILQIDGGEQIPQKAVNKKLLNKAIRNYNMYAPEHGQSGVIQEIAQKVTTNKMTYRDALDTLIAIKPYAQNTMDSLLSMISRIENIVKHLNP